jgi:hypothetical protein
VAPDFAEPLTTAIAEFLRAIGIDIEARELSDGTFLPGVALDRGRLLVDESRLTYPGDLLHEGGHAAVAPAAARAQLTGSVEVPGIDMGELEVAVVPWSYAAALAIGIPPAEVFHAGGYRGRSEGILATFAAGVYPGVHLLEASRMTATGPRAAALGVPPYPHMIRWLRD